MKQKESLLKNIFVLSAILFGTSMLICYVGVLVIGQSIYYMVGILSVIIVGQMYVSKFKEIMPNGTRIAIILIYTVIQLAIAFVYLAFTIKKFNSLILFMLLSVSLFMVIQAVLMNWVLKFFEKNQLKHIQNQQQKSYKK